MQESVAQRLGSALASSGVKASSRRQAMRSSTTARTQGTAYGHAQRLRRRGTNMVSSFRSGIGLRPSRSLEAAYVSRAWATVAQHILEEMQRPNSTSVMGQIPSPTSLPGRARVAPSATVRRL